MKIAVTAKQNKGIDSEVDPRFGRANYFAVLDTKSMEIDFIQNTAAETSSGAGVMAAQLIADQKVSAVISGSFGPKAFNTLNTAGIKLYSSKGSTIKEVVEQYNKGILEQVTAASNSGHIGIR